MGSFYMVRKPTYEELERRVAELENECLEHRLTSLMANLPGMVYRCLNDQGWTMEFVSGGCSDLLEYKPADLIGNQTVSYDDLIHPDDRALVQEQVQEAVAKERQFHVTYRIQTASGKEKWVLDQGVAILSNDGEIVALEGIVSDITNSKRFEEALQQRSGELSERGKELHCLFSVSSLVEKRGISLEEILQGVVELIPPALQYPDIAVARMNLEGREFKTPNFTETKWLQVTDIIVHDIVWGSLEVCYLEERPNQAEGPFLKEEHRLFKAIAERMGRLIERKEAEKALEVSERRFRRLVENSPVGISIIQDDRVVYQNPEQERLFGPFPRPSKLTDFDSIHADDIEKVKEFHRNINAEGFDRKDIDFRFYPKDASGNRRDMKWVHFRASGIEYQGKEAILINVMDLTRVKELESFLRIEDKMSSLGRVAAGIAHEIRNPLSGINIYLNTLQKMYDKEDGPEKVMKILKQILSASNKIESVIRRVMDFSKPNEPRLVLTNINEPIEEALNLSSVTIRKRGIKLEKDLAEDLELCRIDPNLIEQVILNLITNAAEAMKDFEGAKKIRVSSFAKNGRIMVSVSDSGPGIPFSFREKVFDPFYTTKNGSTGIGLSLSHRIIEDHGGKLRVSRSEWDGAEFILELPTEKGRNQI
jgi:PAS domain S-box-containing protein